MGKTCAAESTQINTYFGNKSSRIREAGHVARSGEINISENLKERVHLEDLGVDGR
jgi:hypothetical protein